MYWNIKLIVKAFLVVMKRKEMNYNFSKAN